MFFIRDENKNESGPYSADEIWGRINNRQCNLFTMARRRHEERWKMLGAFIEFARIKNMPGPAGGTTAPIPPMTTRPPLQTRPPMSLREMVAQKKIREATRPPFSVTRPPFLISDSKPDGTPGKPAGTHPPAGAAKPTTPEEASRNIPPPPASQPPVRGPVAEPASVENPSATDAPFATDAESAAAPQNTRPSPPPEHPSAPEPPPLPPPGAAPPSPPPSAGQPPPLPSPAAASGAAPPPAPEARPARFDLPRPVKIIYGGIAAFWFVVLTGLAMLASGAGTPFLHALAQCMFTLFAILAFPSAVSFTAWVIRKRSRKAASISLLVTLSLTTLLALGAIVAALTNGFRLGFTRSVEASRQMLRDAARQNSQSAPSPAPAAKSITQAAPDAQIETALKRTLARLKAEVDEYQAACEKTIPRALAFSSFQGKEEIVARLGEVAALSDKRARLAQTLGNATALLREELAREGLPADVIEQASATLSPGLDSQRELLLATMASEGRLLFALAGLLNLLGNKWGEWECDTASGQLRFKDAGTLDQFNQFIKDIQTEAASRSRMQ
jgi:hypothetical protein